MRLYETRTRTFVNRDVKAKLDDLHGDVAQILDRLRAVVPDVEFEHERGPEGEIRNTWVGYPMS